MDAKKNKQQLLDKLYEPYRACMQCPLSSLGRTNIVFGHGNPDAQLMFIGEGPGKDEDEQGIPFVGRSGKLLTATLEDLGIKREDVFITNIVKCRPPNNRKPSPLESTTCKNLLLNKQIHIINPTVICTLGSSATQNIIGREIKITKTRGIPISTKSAIIVPTYHPAYILRNPKKLKNLKEDIQTALSFLSAIQK